MNVDRGPPGVADTARQHCHSSMLNAFHLELCQHLPLRLQDSPKMQIFAQSQELQAQLGHSRIPQAVDTSLSTMSTAPQKQCFKCLEQCLPHSRLPGAAEGMNDTPPPAHEDTLFCSTAKNPGLLVSLIASGPGYCLLSPGPLHTVQSHL